MDISEVKIQIDDFTNKKKRWKKSATKINNGFYFYNTYMFILDKFVLLKYLKMTLKINDLRLTKCPTPSISLRLHYLNRIVYSEIILSRAK